MTAQAIFITGGAPDNSVSAPKKQKSYYYPYEKNNAWPFFEKGSYCRKYGSKPHAEINLSWQLKYATVSETEEFDNVKIPRKDSTEITTLYFPKII